MFLNSPGLNRAKDRFRSAVSLFKISIEPGKKQSIVDEFHKYYYSSARKGMAWADNKFLGYEIQKCPFDQMVYQEIIYELKPDLIIETGTAYGGNALFLATICDLVGKGQVVSVDIVNTGKLPKHKRIKYILGSSIDEKVIEKLKELKKGKRKVMVILDSDHTRNHVFAELNLYSNLVTKGSYLIVEDTNINGHPVYPDHGPGPKEALDDWLATTNEFKVDLSKEKHHVSFNAGGYLKRIG